MVINPYNTMLEDFYKATPEEILNFTKECEKGVYSSLKKDFSKSSKDTTGYATENFRKNFWYEEGIPRTWNKVPANTIDELYEKNKNPPAIFFSTGTKLLLPSMFTIKSCPILSSRLRFSTKSTTACFFCSVT